MSEENGKVRDALDFTDLEPVELPVTILGKKYILLEAGGDAELKRRNHLFKFSSPGEKGKLVPKEGYADFEPIMVSLCLYKADRDGNLPRTKDGLPDVKERVPVETVRAWPNRYMKKIYEKLMDISGMGPDTIEELEELIRDCQDRLAKLRAGAAGPKGGPASTTAG